MICPYCDSGDAILRSPIRTEFKDEDRLFIIVREVVCPECKRTSYAVRSIKDEERDYEVSRRDELKERTGIRLIRPVLSKRGC